VAGGGVTREFFDSFPGPRAKAVLHSEDDESISFDLLRGFVDLGLCNSKSEARRLMRQGGLRVNGAVLTGSMQAEAYFGRWLILARGKRTVGLLELPIESNEVPH
jgi:tyrosyl-tRNA synthetase